MAVGCVVGRGSGRAISWGSEIATGSRGRTRAPIVRWNWLRGSSVASNFRGLVVGGYLAAIAAAINPRRQLRERTCRTGHSSAGKGPTGKGQRREFRSGYSQAPVRDMTRNGQREIYREGALARAYVVSAT